MPRGYPGTGPTAGKAKKAAAKTAKPAAVPPSPARRKFAGEDLLSTLDELSRVRDILSERGRLAKAEVTVLINGQPVNAEYDGNDWQIGL